MFRDKYLHCNDQKRLFARWCQKYAINYRRAVLGNFLDILTITINNGMLVLEYISQNLFQPFLSLT